MATDETPYQAELEALADDDINRATVRGSHQLELDEPNWSDRGEDRAPCPVDYLLVGVAGCQLESLRHCLEKSRVEDYRVEMSVEGEFEDPADPSSGIPAAASNRLDAIRLSVQITTTAEDESRVDRCLEIAEDRGCVVSRTVTEGVDVSLEESVTVASDE